MISFRQSLQPFTAYTLRFSMQCWVERWNYFCSEFEHAGQKMVSGLTEGAVVGSNCIVRSADARGAMGMDAVLPTYPAIKNDFEQQLRIHSCAKNK